MNRLYRIFLSEEVKHKSERIVTWIAVGGFVIHLLLIGMVELGWLKGSIFAEMETNPIGAIITPFSFILIYEVFLLVYYIPKSTTTYIGKQYEIITLIVIRRNFKDLANLDLTTNWFQTKYDLQFTYDILATLVLFFLIFLFYRLNKSKDLQTFSPESLSPRIKRFISLKRTIALILVPILLVLAIFSFADWVYESIVLHPDSLHPLTDINKIFFDEFFTILIMTDVLLLLISFTLTEKFNKVIRNSGFIVSTILLKISFSTDGLMNTLLIVVAVLFGVAILGIHNLFEKQTSGSP